MTSTLVLIAISLSEIYYLLVALILSFPFPILENHHKDVSGVIDTQ